MGRPVVLMGGRTREEGGEPGAGRGGAPRSGGAEEVDAATEGGAGRGDAAAGRAGVVGAERAGGGGVAISLAGRLVTRRWRSGAGAIGGETVGVGEVAGPFGAGSVAGDRVDGGSDPAAATFSSVARPARAAVARAGFCSAGSSGWTARRRPSLSALRRTRSAWASSIEDEWLFTPMPNDTQRSRASLLVRPSSRASS